MQTAWHPLYHLAVSLTDIAVIHDMSRQNLPGVSTSGARAAADGRVLKTQARTNDRSATAWVMVRSAYLWNRRFGSDRDVWR